MLVEAQVTIHGSKAAVWAAITDIENAAKIISGIDKIEVLEKPANGIIELKWRETRMLFGKPATVEKCITDATEGEFYKTKAEDEKCVYLTTKSVSESDGSVTLSEAHKSEPKNAVAKSMLAIMGVLFKGVARKAILQDMNDIKATVEQK